VALSIVIIVDIDGLGWILKWMLFFSLGLEQIHWSEETAKQVIYICTFFVGILLTLFFFFATHVVFSCFVNDLTKILLIVFLYIISLYKWLTLLLDMKVHIYDAIYKDM